MTIGPEGSAVAIADRVRSGRISAIELVTSALNKIARLDPKLNCFTRVLSAQALEDAQAIDAAIAGGRDPGLLAGVPFAVKDLFDVARLSTTAGAGIRRGAPVATDDAVVVERLRRAGAILIGTLNMDEFAYGFSTENAHFGTTLNPHDSSRLAGGSSGGSAAAVAAGFVPITLGSDTNGSVRVPASLCGVFGLRPTHGALSLDGVFPFVERLDTVGVFTRTAADARLAFEVMSGDEAPPRSTPLKAARLGGWFRANADRDGLAGVDVVAASLGADAMIDLSLAGAARSAAFLITAQEGGRRHLEALRCDAMAFDPATRDRLIAGACVPDQVVQDAEQIAQRFIAQVEALFDAYDVLIAPTTPSVAPLVSAGLIEVDGRMVSARANLGLYTQPLSLTGAPVMTAPLARRAGLPFGVQLVAAPGQEGRLFDVASQLEAQGLVACNDPPALEGGA